MAEVKFQKGTEEFQLFKDYWTLIQSYWIPEKNDTYWDDVQKDTAEFYKKYNTSFAKDLAIAYLNELERKSKL